MSQGGGGGEEGKEKGEGNQQAARGFNRVGLN